MIKHITLLCILANCCVIAFAQPPTVAPIPNPPEQPAGKFESSTEARGQTPIKRQPTMLRSVWNARPKAVYITPEQRAIEIAAEQQHIVWKHDLERQYELNAKRVKFSGKLARQQLGNAQYYQLQQMYGMGGGLGYMIPNAGYGGHNYVGSRYYGNMNWTNPILGYGYVGQGYNRP